jgi:hypothetical protein
MSAQNFSAPDLTQHPPRSARARLGGYAILPRMLDKGRATLAGKNGEYHFACPLDQGFLDFVGMEAEAVKAQLAAGLGDGEMLAWIEANAKNKRSPWEIHQWTEWQGTRVPGAVEGREYFNEIHKSAGPNREDIFTWAEMLDLDDYVTFGGKA